MRVPYRVGYPNILFYVFTVRGVRGVRGYRKGLKAAAKNTRKKYPKELNRLLPLMRPRSLSHGAVMKPEARSGKSGPVVVKWLPDLLTRSRVPGGDPGWLPDTIPIVEPRGCNEAGGPG